MIVSKNLNIVVFIVIQFLLGCKNKQLNPECGEASVRLMVGWCGQRLETIRGLSDNIDRNTDGLDMVISNLRRINNEFVVLAGGYKTGKSLEMIDPCRKGEQISESIKSFELGKNYNELVNQCLLNDLINEGIAANMRFIINAYFCKESCALSNKNLNQVPIGLLSLENFTLQFTLLVLIESGIKNS